MFGTPKMIFSHINPIIWEKIAVFVNGYYMNVNEYYIMILDDGVDEAFMNKNDISYK